MIKDLKEAIAHAKEKAKELSDKAYAEYGKTMTEEQACECNECALEHEQLAAWLTELQERRAADKWILVSKKLPPVNSEVIVTDRDVLTSYQATYVGKGYWECDNGTFNDRIVAWKWFPETYKESEDN